MPVKNFWSLEPGVVIFVDELLKRFKGKADFYFPFKDTGIDLIGVTKDFNRVVTFQVKESRYYEGQNKYWHQIGKKALSKNSGKVDFYVFLIYFPSCMMKDKKNRRNEFQKDFIIVPEKDLLENIRFKKGRKNIYDFHFRFEGQKLLDVRESNSKRDYSRYLDGWHLIEDRMNKAAKRRPSKK